MKTCPQCVKQLPDDAVFCSRCGVELASGQLPQRKRKFSAWIVVAVLGGLFVLAIPVVLIVAAIAIPNLIRARIAANEASAISGVRTIVLCLADYQNRNKQYPASLSALSCNVQMPPGLTRGERNGYRFVYQSADSDGNGSFDVFTVHADPLIQERTGTRHFFEDGSGIIRVTSGSEPASAESPPLE